MSVQATAPYTGYPTQITPTTPITLATLVQQPTRVHRYLSDISLRHFFAMRLFSQAGDVTGGAVLYDQLTVNDLFTERDVQDVADGAEYPIVADTDPTPMLAKVGYYGAKFFVTDQDIKRDNTNKVRREGRRVINTIFRKTDQKALAVIEASIAQTPSQIITGVNWQNVVVGGTSPTQPGAMPASDFAKVRLAEDRTELGVRTNLWIVNPAELSQLALVYGDSLKGLLDSNNVEIMASMRVPAGTAYVAEAGQVGEMRFEEGLNTESWRENKRRGYWFQTSIAPAIYVTDPYSIYKIQGLKG